MSGKLSFPVFVFGADSAHVTRIALRIAYDGQRYPGWQTQPGGGAVQDIVERALAQVAAQPVRTLCAGRTDAGVHAVAQVVHFDCAAERPDSAWVRGTNAHLPDDIAVQSASRVAPTFDARRSARRRRYHYLIHRAAQRHPLWAGRAAWVYRPLDVAAMQAAARGLVGEHDFSAFRSSECQARSPVRDLQRLDIREHAGGLLVFELIANGFLHHMVRNLVGALVWVGLGRRDTAWPAAVLASRRREEGAATFASEGLYLSGVQYDEPLAPGGCWPELADALPVGPPAVQG